MNQEQFNQLMVILERVLSKTFTLTSAADWPILVIIMGVLFAVIGFMWVDLRNIVKDNRSEWKVDLAKHEAANESDSSKLWGAMRDCQNDCCPRRKE